jgi:hypothetical protein
MNTPDDSNSRPTAEAVRCCFEKSDAHKIE